MKKSNAKRFGVTAVAFLGLLGAIANAGHHGEMKAKDIVDTAVSAGQFNTMAAALDAADLIPTLKGEFLPH